MTERITATRAVREFSELLNRIRFRGDRYVIERNGKPVACLEPLRAQERGGKLKEFKGLIQALPGLGKDLERFAADVRAAASEQPSLPEAGPWA